MRGRWDDYVMASGTPDDPCEALWEAAAHEPRGGSMLVLGVGFDPRCLVALQQLLSIDLPSPLTILRIELPPQSPASDPTTRALAADNLEAFEQITETAEVTVIDYPPVQERINAGPKIAREVADPQRLTDIGHVVIDVSSLPSTIYFPAIKALLLASDLPEEQPEHFGGEVQVVACENPVIDAAISELGVSDATVVGGFRSNLDADASSMTVWAPVIGEHCHQALRAIHAFLTPKDTTPILPFPARNPRRADDLLLEHDLELFDEFRVPGSNIIYADERNPFDLYRTLRRLDSDCKEALKPLGSTTLAVSSHSSKLLSLGVLLASYENELPIMAAPASDYSLQDDDQLDGASGENRIACLWLSGAPYS